MENTLYLNASYCDYNWKLKYNSDRSIVLSTILGITAKEMKEISNISHKIEKSQSGFFVYWHDGLNYLRIEVNAAWTNKSHLKIKTPLPGQSLADYIDMLANVKRKQPEQLVLFRGEE